MQKLNNGSLRLELIPASAKRAAGVTHDIALRKELLGTQPEALLSLDVGAVVVPSLHRVKAEFGTELQVTSTDCKADRSSRVASSAERADCKPMATPDLATE